MGQTQGLLLITETWPWDGAVESSFIEPELPHLVEHFHRVIVMPTLRRGDLRTLPLGVELDTRLADNLDGRWRRDILCNSAIWRSPKWLLHELLEKTFAYSSPRLIRRMLRFAADAFRATAAVELHLEARAEPSVVLYSYWCTAPTMGALLAAARHPSRVLPVVTRVHGYDLFEARHSPPVLPFRSEVMRRLNFVICASQAAIEHTYKQYPQFGDKLRLFRLGVKPATCRAVASADGSIRIVSCSATVDFKRVDLIFSALQLVATAKPKSTIVWTHFGGGPGFTALRDKCRRAPANMRVHLAGHVANDVILEHYEKTPVDVFVHLSCTEGGVPVAIQEALSFGIPVVAAAAGGVPEAVDSEVGELLPLATSADAVRDAMVRVLARERAELADRCIDRWSDRFNADSNHERFAEFLASVSAV